MELIKARIYLPKSDLFRLAAKKEELKMKNKIYNSPEISVIDFDTKDIITTSDIEAGLETPPTETGGGTWETI